MKHKILLFGLLLMILIIVNGCFNENVPLSTCRVDVVHDSGKIIKNKEMAEEVFSMFKTDAEIEEMIQVRVKILEGGFIPHDSKKRINGWAPLPHGALDNEGLLEGGYTIGKNGKIYYAICKDFA